MCIFDVTPFNIISLNTGICHEPLCISSLLRLSRLPQTWWFKRCKLLFHGSAGQKSDIGLTELKLRCWQIYGPAGGSQGRSVSLPFALSRGCSHSSPCGSFLHLHSLHWQAGSLLTWRHPGRWHVHVTFSGSCPLLPSFTSKDPRDSIGSTG